MFFDYFNYCMDYNELNQVTSKNILFVRSPKLTQMRDPLDTEWNHSLMGQATRDTKNNKQDMPDLVKFIDFSQMNKIFANYLEVVGLPVAIIDLEGKVLASSKWQRLCMEFHRVHETTLARCLESDTSLSHQMQAGKEYAIYRCRNGLTDCSSPIIVENQHIANLFIGQFFLKPPNKLEFGQQCAEFGFDHDAYFNALAEVPIVEEKKIPAIINLLVGIAHQVAQQSLTDYRAKISYENVERQVIERTRALQATNSLLLHITAQITGVVYQYLLRPDGTSCIPYASDGIREIFELEPEDVREDAAKILQRIHPHDFEQVTGTILESRRNLTPWRNQFRVILPRQGLRWREGNSNPELQSDGSVLWHGFMSDITARKETEIKLLEAKATAEAANFAKSRFLANMSHEIRTPMNAVLGILQLLQHTALSPIQMDYAKKAETAARSLLDIINDILDFSKVEAGKLELEQRPFQLHELLRNLSVVLSTAARDKDIEVLFDITPALPRWVIGDGLRLQQILLNLAGNAIKFTMHGEVMVTLRLISLATDHARIEFSVRDTGIGIPSDKLSTIFDGFKQADASTTRRFGGTGLGLAISQRLVRLMGGELIVESVLDRGTCFSFMLDFPRDTHVDDISHENTSLRVLIIDDNVNAREVFRHMIAWLAWQADIYDSGEEALALLEASIQNNSRYDAVFMDWPQSGINGSEIAPRICAYCADKHVPIVIMATAHDQQLLTGKNKLSQDFLIKPITPSMLVDAVTDATHRHFVDTSQYEAHPPAVRRLDGLRLLIAEDNATNQLVARGLLTREGAQIDIVENGRQCVDHLAITAVEYDAVLMDVQMPVMDGIEATRVLRRTGFHLPIIAMTANAMPADREECLAAGMDDHVGKPFDMEILVTKLLRHCSTVTAVAEPLVMPKVAESFLHPVLTRTLPGFQLKLALTRLEKNLGLFAELARSFCDETYNVAASIRQLLRDGDHGGAIRYLHTLKGAAATLGACALSDLAALAERHLKDNGDTNEFDGLLARLDSTTNEAVATLQEIILSINATNAQ
ncbi:two-component system, sensor histidine kinase and response regulator [Gammaproteobacteria bacterium]